MMDNYHGAGDLTDILRATGTGSCTATEEWRHDLTSNYPLNYSCDPVDDFGDPFTHLRDPLLQEIPEFSFSSSSTTVAESSNGPSTREFARIQVADKNLDEMIKRPIISSSSSIFSRMLQISPNAATTKSPRFDTSAISSRGCLVESSGGASLQISSPRTTGIKKRKSQAKKVVCIPAPAPANSRPSSGEIVPSDLWAWRKYGQKPIKGSPYPRGYYKCSSSKGCSARKQVERSRNDPNMLVITYTFDHNHPWPTQRNALAGSTRNYNPTKNTNNHSSNSKPDQNPEEEEEEQIKEMTRENTIVDPNSTTVKEEMDQNNQLKTCDEGFTQFGYKPAMPDGSEDSFFADLGEIEANDDPLDLLFNQGFSNQPENKGLDPFGFDYWAGNENNINTTPSTTSATETIKRSS